MSNATMNNCTHKSGTNNLFENSHSTAIGTVLLSLAALIGLPGNFFVIWSILWKMRLRHRSVTCLLVLNLAVADGAVLLLTPFFIHFLIVKNWVFGVPVCKAVYYLCCINMFASICIITLMSIDRCLAVNQPYFSQAIRRKQLVAKILAGIWLAAILLSIPAPIFRQVVQYQEHDICEPCHSKPALAIFHFTLEIVAAFVIPFTIIVGCYSAILLRLRGVRRRPGARTEKLIVAIVACFVVLWTPYHIINMLQVASNIATGPLKDQLDSAWKRGRAGATALAFLSSSINPVLYVFAAGNLIKTSGANFMAKFFEGASDDIGRRSHSHRNLANGLVVIAGAATDMEQQPLGEVYRGSQSDSWREQAHHPEYSHS